ncbi:MAG: hypothetical protein LCH37_12915 [Bacteroidetes bacterium]|nr:hypothetical protein [Bacteroidota bacterium]
MITIYLKSIEEAALFEKINSIIEGFSGGPEFSDGVIHGHWIGKIALTFNLETGEVLTWDDAFHANLLVPDNFDLSALDCFIIPPPKNPVHKFA